MVKVLKLALFNLSFIFVFNQIICFDIIDSKLIDNSNLNLNLDLKSNDETGKLNHIITTFNTDAKSIKLLNLQNNFIAIITKLRDCEEIIILDISSNKIIQNIKCIEKDNIYYINTKLLKLKNGSLVYFFKIDDAYRNSRRVADKMSNNIKIWTLNEDGSYKYSQDLVGHTKTVDSVIQTKDGSLISGSSDNIIKVWKINEHDKYECIQTIDTYKSDNNINSLNELKNGYLVSCSSDKTIKIWKQNKDGLYTLIENITDHKGSVLNITELKNGNLISCSNDGTAKIWKFNKEKNEKHI